MKAQSHTVRAARLKAAQARWAREDRQRGYTTYRNGRPHASVQRNSFSIVDWLVIVAAISAAGYVMGLGF